MRNGAAREVEAVILGAVEIEDESLVGEDIHLQNRHPLIHRCKSEKIGIVAGRGRLGEVARSVLSPARGDGGRPARVARVRVGVSPVALL